MNVMPALTLPADYLESRTQFQVLAARAGARLHAYPHAGMQPRLFTDVAFLGPEDAPTLILIASGTHGVEGYAGAACQLRFLHHYRSRYADRGLAYLLVHAVNPWGFFYDRRVTHEGVDLNRNFVAFPLRRRGPSDYAAYHDLLVRDFQPLPRGLFNELRLLGSALTRERRRQLQAAITAGQHDYADGLFFGGAAPTQSRLIWEDIVHTYVRGRQRTILLDLHTGLGKHGAGELISHLPPSHPDFARMSRWFGGSLKSMASGESVSAAVEGTLTAAFGTDLAGQHDAVGLEFGTAPPLAVLNALRADHWYHNNAARLPPQVREHVRRKMKAAFSADDVQWQRQVAARFDEVMEKLTAALGAASPRAP